MRRVLWVFAWVAVAFWSLFAFVAHGVIDGLGSLAIRNSDLFSADPETVEWISNVLTWIRGISSSAVTAIWGIVSLLILSVPWLLDRLVGRQTPGTVRPAPSGVIDLGPGDYRVDGPAVPRPGVVPRVGPRT